MSHHTEFTDQGNPRLSRRWLFPWLLLLSLLAAACGPGEPDIHLPARSRDLGEVPLGEVVTFEVPLQNEGTGDLTIEAVTTSCGCTTAEVEPWVVAPGGEARLLVTFDSGAHGPEGVGPVARQVFIRSNDPDEPEVEFRFQAVVVPVSP